MARRLKQRICVGRLSIFSTLQCYPSEDCFRAWVEVLLASYIPGAFPGVVTVGAMITVEVGMPDGVAADP